MRRTRVHTRVTHRYRAGAGRSRAVLICIGLVLLHATVASADDGDPRFRRTTPRAALDAVDGALVIGVP